MNPIVEQEAKKGNIVLAITDVVMLEISEFKGKRYASLRKWWKTEDGTWARSKNGLHILTNEMREVLGKSDQAQQFISDRLKAMLDELNREVESDGVPY